MKTCDIFREARKQRGLSRRQVAEMMSVKVSWIVNRECDRSRITLADARRLAAAYGMDDAAWCALRKPPVSS